MDADELPPPNRRRNWFAVWHWPRWTWGIVLVLMLVAYFLSAIPVIRIVRQKFPPSGRAEIVMANLFWPVTIAIGHLDFVRIITNWESGVMDRILGPEESNIISL